MAGVEENGAAIGDWRAPIPSPRSFFSAFLSEEIVSRSFSQIINGAELAVVDSEEWSVLDKKENDDAGFSGGFPVSCGKAPGGRNGGSIAERRAAKGGFNAPRLNTARFRTTSPLNSPAGIRSPYLTIPPGLSPTTLLDSPVMLLSSQAQPSPTTGTYMMPPFSHESLMSGPVADNTIEAKHVDDGSSFVFKPHMNPVSVPCLPSIGNQVSSIFNQAKQLGMDDVRCQAEVQPEIEFDCQAEFLTKATINEDTTNSPSDLEMPDKMIAQENPMAIQICTSGVANDQISQHEEKLHGEDGRQQQLLEGDERGSFPPTGMGKPSEDGYNWRKYGQKQVKGSEYPRSYYKCTHQNCQVKKKVECSRDGQITEIIYKGAHNHAKPQPSRRTGIGSAFAVNDIPERPEGPSSYVKAGGGSVWRGIQQGPNDKSGTDLRGDGLERTSSASIVTELSDPLSTSQGKHLPLLEPADTPELSSTLASHDDDEDRNTQGSISLGDDADDEESDSKRRKIESSLNPNEANMASRAVREPKVVVQTTSEVDILDDGYRWRKYGQKVVKGNPNPRSYYKCTSAGCSVRKHVERASHDLKSVITTYEGKHNHEVPVARNSGHCNNSGTGNGPSATSAPTAIPRPPKPEPQVQDLAPRFERNPEQLSNEYLKPVYLANLSDIQPGASSACYDMKLPPLQPLAFGSYGMRTNLKEIAPDFPISLPMGLHHRSANITMASLGFNAKAGDLVQSFFGQQQAKEGDMRFLRPKEEQEEPAYETQRLSTNHPSNVFPTIYHQTMGGFPL